MQWYSFSTMNPKANASRAQSPSPPSVPPHPVTPFPVFLPIEFDEFPDHLLDRQGLLRQVFRFRRIRRAVEKARSAAADDAQLREIAIGRAAGLLQERSVVCEVAADAHEPQHGLNFCPFTIVIEIDRAAARFGDGRSGKRVTGVGMERIIVRCAG